LGQTKAYLSTRYISTRSSWNGKPRILGHLLL
jgi:hypothetical protein